MIRLRPAARGALLAQQKPTRRGLQRAIDELTGNPHPKDAVALTSPPGARRRQVGAHQVIYQEEETGEILILLIAPTSHPQTHPNETNE